MTNTTAIVARVNRSSLQPSIARSPQGMVPTAFQTYERVAAVMTKVIRARTNLDKIFHTPPCPIYPMRSSTGRM